MFDEYIILRIMKNVNRKVYLHIDQYSKTCIIVYVRPAVQPLKKGSEEMDDMNTTEALLRAVLELIEKCQTLEELRESVKRIVKDE